MIEQVLSNYQAITEQLICKSLASIEQVSFEKLSQKYRRLVSDMREVAQKSMRKKYTFFHFKGKYKTNFNKETCSYLYSYKQGQLGLKQNVSFSHFLKALFFRFLRKELTKEYPKKMRIFL